MGDRSHTLAAYVEAAIEASAAAGEFARYARARRNGFDMSGARYWQAQAREAHQDREFAMRMIAKRLREQAALVREYATTGDAYDAVQTDPEVRKGDILLIRSEGVVGIADTWPVAITHECGELHHVKHGEALDYLRERGADRRLAEACDIARANGWLTVLELEGYGETGS